MDVALGQNGLNCDLNCIDGLNPCCNGCRTWAMKVDVLNSNLIKVLILVVMDVALGQVFSQTLRNQ